MGLGACTVGRLAVDSDVRVRASLLKRSSSGPTLPVPQLVSCVGRGVQFLALLLADTVGEASPGTRRRPQLFSRTTAFE